MAVKFYLNCLLSESLGDDLNQTIEQRVPVYITVNKDDQPRCSEQCHLYVCAMVSFEVCVADISKQIILHHHNYENLLVPYPLSLLAVRDPENEGV